MTTERSKAEAIIDTLDELLNTDDFDGCNERLRLAVVDGLSDLEIVTYLGITSAARSKLPGRAEFYGRALATVAKRRGAAGADKLLSKYW